jgi:hypothetical protein
MIYEICPPPWDGVGTLILSPTEMLTRDPYAKIHSIIPLGNLFYNKDHELAYIMASNKKIIKQQFAAIAP